MLLCIVLISIYQRAIHYSSIKPWCKYYENLIISYCHSILYKNTFCIAIENSNQITSKNGSFWSEERINHFSILWRSKLNVCTNNTVWNYPLLFILRKVIVISFVSSAVYQLLAKKIIELLISLFKKQYTRVSVKQISSMANPTFEAVFYGLILQRHTFFLNLLTRQKNI